MENILVLNADNKPLNITSFKKGFKLVFKGKAEVVSFIDDKPVESSTRKYKRPTIIRLFRYIYIPFKKVPLSRFNIYRRDGHVCAYCKSRKDLTLDHVLPKSRGGENSWKNLVTCCKTCNSKKDNRTPTEAGMTLLVKPYKPTFQQFAIAINGSRNDDWTKYFK